MIDHQGVAPTLSEESSDPCVKVHFPRWQSIREHLWQNGVFNHEDPPWLLSPDPFPLTPEDLAFFESLGQHLLTFNQAINRLYLDSLRGSQPAWVHRYLDQGKPAELLDFAQMKRFRDPTPSVIRPDVLPTDQGMKITELDSVPGGIGITGCLSAAYAALGSSLIGGNEGILQGFAEMLRATMKDQPEVVAIVVSDEAEGYRAEMTWVAHQLGRYNVEAYCVHPRDLRFTEEGLYVGTPNGEASISLVYRFFELFDLKNVPKAELIMYALKKGRVAVTPPFKPWLEEKLAFALLHHPMLESFWAKALGAETFDCLLNWLPRTWVLDPAPLPPSAIIPKLHLGTHAVSDWKMLGLATQKQRQFVVKPSGFSDLAWGSRGISIGHDLPQSEWASALDSALESFPTTPYILQEFHKGKQYHHMYYHEGSRECRIMAGRVRLSPFYFVHDQQAHLAGILATLCPKNKKVIHGMRDAIMAPCALQAPDNMVS